MAIHTSTGASVIDSVIITVTGASLRNGRLYFDRVQHANFFPSECIGDRQVPAVQHVSIEAGGERMLGDIREHGTRLSPRRSFARFLKQIGAREGTPLRVSRLTPSEYRVDTCA